MPTLQWQRSTDGGANFVNDTTDTGATTATLTVNNPTVAMSGYQYRVLASNSVQSNVASNAAALTVNQASQTITFGAIADHTYGTTPFALTASSTSGLPVSFSVLSGPASISGNTVTLTGAGAVTIRASQAGNADYSAATPVDRSFNSVTTGLDLYFTDFESFPLGNDMIAGTDGWLSSNATGGTSGILLNGGSSKVGWVGLNATAAPSTYVWRPINYDPVAAGTPTLQFTVDVTVVDSTNGQRDTFGFVLVNAAPTSLPLGAIYFDNTTQTVFRYDGVTTANTGIGFARGTTYTLAVAINFATNRWSAVLGGTVLFGNQPINVQGRAMTLGDIDPLWIVSSPGNPGNNYLTFDNYRISTYAPPIFTTQPAPQSVTVGGTATFTVVVSGTPPPTLQWQRSTDGGANFTDDTTDTGVTTPTLTVNNVTGGMSGYRYRALGTNLAQSNVASDAATLTVTTTFAAWQQSHFTAGELADVNVSGPNAVYGLDGLTNLVKYALGLDPKTDATSTVLPVVSTTATDWVYTYTRPSSTTDLTCAVEVSTNLTTWTTAGVTLEFVSTSGGIDTWRARYPLASAANAFFRLKVTR